MWPGPDTAQLVIGGFATAYTLFLFDMTVVDVPPETIIYGEMWDDSHMHGVLARIRDLGLHVVSVQQIRE